MTVGEFGASGSEVIFDALGQVLMRGANGGRAGVSSSRLQMVGIPGACSAGTDLIESRAPRRQRAARGAAEVPQFQRRRCAEGRRRGDRRAPFAPAPGRRDVERASGKIFAEYRPGLLAAVYAAGRPARGVARGSPSRSPNLRGIDTAIRARKGCVGGSAPTTDIGCRA